MMEILKWTITVINLDKTQNVYEFEGTRIGYANHIAGVIDQPGVRSAGGQLLDEETLRA
jgi:hypothetical protein